MARKQNLNKALENCKHPSSRKAIALGKKIKKINSREKSKSTQNLKQNVIAEKIMWFKDNLEPTGVCSADQLLYLIEKYIARFDSELQQIELKHSIGGRKNRQHANREDIIKMTRNREQEEFQTCGFEAPDLLNSSTLEILRKWDGELKYLQNIKLKRYSKSVLLNVIKNK